MESDSMNKRLTDKQKVFCEQYLIDLNATQAAIRAGYAKKTARQMGTENLSKPVIKTAIEKAMVKAAEKASVSVDEVIAGIKEIAFAELGEGISASEKLKGFELLGKYLGMFDSRFATAPGRVTINMNYNPPKQIDSGITVNVEPGLCF
jgi:phage terminase small subunit